MKHYEIRTQCGELVGEGETIEAAILAALDKITVDDFIDYYTWGKETTDGIECYSMYDLYFLAVKLTRNRGVNNEQRTITIDISKAIKDLDFGALTANKDLLNLISLGAYGAAKYFESKGCEVIVEDFKALAKTINEVIL